jgi:Tol biopolymer transport system component
VRLSPILALAALLAVGATYASSERSPARNGLIAFSRTDANGTSSIFTVDPRSRRLTRLTGRYSSWPTTPVWAPGGSISFAGEGGRITLVDAQSGQTRTLPKGVHSEEGFAWSPDGRHIVLQRGAGLVVVKRDGRLVRRMTKSSDDTEPAWSPDGRTIAFVRDDEVFLVAAGGGRARRLGAGNVPAWAPNSRQVVVADLGGELFLLNVGGGRRHQLTHHGQGCVGEEPAWAPAGRIAFISCGGLALVDPATGVVTNLGLSSSTPSWSPDGASLVVGASFDDEEPQYGFRVVDVATGSTRDLTFGPRVGSDAEPAWSPDGRSLAVTGFPSLRILSANGAERRVVPEAFGEPSWAPDGQRLIAQTDDCCTFSIIDLRTGEQDDVLVDEGAGDPTPCSPSWSPGGRWIAFSQTEALGIGLYDVRKQKERTLAFGGSHPDWRPGGRMLAFDTTEVCYGRPHRSRRTAVLVAPVNGKRGRVVARNASDPAWSPDGRQIAFVRLVGRRNNPEIFVMNANGSRQRRLTSYPGWDLAPDWQRVPSSR